MSSSPSKSSGQWNSAMGSVKESVGNTFGARNMAAKGRDQHARGEAEIHQAKAKGYAE
ncbi:hypothetical protein FRC03_008313 [Tulasnella sp. 419]|nr:hypothetical protein FRC02_004732 [Tulasnella sp. 418]KAG8959191.1 hypothetical protein FRC03_008313 [Tulasnella sp. 419]